MRMVFVTLASSFLVSLYGIAQHSGIDKDIWVQDVQNRVFSTLGQPNWLAAWIVALLPLTWALALNLKLFSQKSKIKTKDIFKFLLWFLLSILLFVTLLFTKSRSGLLGFAFTSVCFWSLTLVKFLKDKGPFYFSYVFLIFNISFLILILFFGTFWIPKLSNVIKTPNYTMQPTSEAGQAPLTAFQGPALETGGTESGEIRKIVWRGAIEIWKHYPIFGSGVETFAFSYYQFRPIEHNLVSEWDYLYNKAHNEYLNYAATTGTAGILTYSILIGAIFLTFFKFKKQNSEFKNTDIISKSEVMNFALFAGFTSILITNFFGFSVVPVALEFFLFPAFALTLFQNPHPEGSNSKVALYQKIALAFILFLTSFFLIQIARYWYADYLYAQSKNRQNQGDFIQARNTLTQAIQLSPKEPVYWNELAQVGADIALSLGEKDEKENFVKFIQLALDESDHAVAFSPYNVNFKRDRARILINFSGANSSFLEEARQTLEDAVTLAPTDAKLYYNLALTYLRLGDTQKSISLLKKTIEMKTNYRDARFALGLIYIDQGMKGKAKEQFEYILTNINSGDKKVQEELDGLKSL